ncbi:MAG: hypothetical protein LC104_12825 [Bacteroidales bacterium]|nr:hypothetical protein [Bacteroidales bacterium]
MLSIIKKGSRGFPRVIVAKGDEFRNPLYWTGSGWSAAEAEAMVFANANDASWVCHDVLMLAVSNRPIHRFVAPIYIELYGDKPKLADLKQWLERAMRIVVDTPKHGLGPKGTVGFVIADVDEMKAV